MAGVHIRVNIIETSVRASSASDGVEENMVSNSPQKLVWKGCLNFHCALVYDN
jgi:hypothetical protein